MFLIACSLKIFACSNCGFGSIKSNSSKKESDVKLKLQVKTSYIMKRSAYYYNILKLQ